MTNSQKLRKVISDKGYKYKFVALRLVINPYTLQQKIDNIREFKASEISKLCELLQLNNEEKDNIFFCSDSDLKSTG